MNYIPPRIFIRYFEFFTVFRYYGCYFIFYKNLCSSKIIDILLSIIIFVLFYSMINLKNEMHSLLIYFFINYAYSFSIQNMSVYSQTYAKLCTVSSKLTQHHNSCNLASNNFGNSQVHLLF